MNKIKFALLITIMIFAFPVHSFAYREPVAANYMSPFCALKSDGSKDTNCLYIKKSDCSYFVSKQGDDNNPGNEASPFGTIQKGVSLLTAGKSLCIKGYSDGTKYTGNVDISNKNGTTNEWIQIGGYEPDKKVVIQGSNYSNGTVLVKDSSFIRVIGMEVTKSNNGFTAQTSNNVDFINLKAYDNYNWGIGVPNSSGPSQRIRMEHSEIFDNVKKNVVDPDWNPNNDRVGQGGTGAQFNEVAEGAYRYNILYRNFGEGLDIHKDANQIIVEDNLFSENSHTSFYVNHASNILFHRNIVICSGEKPSWHAQYNRRDDNLGTAITFRQEKGHNSEDPGGNNAAINNIVVGCTIHIVATTQTSERPSRSLLVANNTFIDARKKPGNNTKPARFVQIQSDASEYAETVLFLNNIYKFVDESASLASSGAVSLNKIVFSQNMTNKAPGFTEGITQVNELPMLGSYDHTMFLGDKIKPWQLSLSQLNNVRRWAMLVGESPALNTGSVNIPENVTATDKNRFENLYSDYLKLDYFGKARGSSPDVGAHEYDGVEPSPSEETAMCISKDTTFGSTGPVKNTLVNYKLRLSRPQSSTKSVVVKDYYSSKLEIVNKPDYCSVANESVQGLSDINIKNNQLLFLAIFVLAVIIAIIIFSKATKKDKVILITGVIFASFLIGYVMDYLKKDTSPDDTDAQVISYLLCNVPAGVNEVTYDAKINGDTGDMINNEALILEDNVEVDSCENEFQVQTASDPTITPTQGTNPTITPTPTNGVSPSNTPTPPISGNICGKSDTNGDGVFTIADFAEFAIKYGQGKNTCADKDVDYGTCGGRDANRDGVLNIADFGAAGIGFAQRYYPKISCAL